MCHSDLPLAFDHTIDDDFTLKVGAFLSNARCSVKYHGSRACTIVSLILRYTDALRLEDRYNKPAWPSDLSLEGQTQHLSQQMSIPAVLE